MLYNSELQDFGVSNRGALMFEFSGCVAHLHPEYNIDNKKLGDERVSYDATSDWDSSRAVLEVTKPDGRILNYIVINPGAHRLKLSKICITLPSSGETSDGETKCYLDNKVGKPIIEKSLKSLMLELQITTNPLRAPR